MGRGLVGPDVGVDEEQLFALRQRVGVVQARLAVAERLDLGADQHQPGFEGVLDGVIEARAPVLGDDLLGAGGLGIRGQGVALPPSTARSR